MKKLLALILACLLSPLPAFAAFGGSTAWDVQTTGADTNGGGFDSGVGSPGTNESVGSGTAISVTLATGTTGTCSPSCTSTTHGPGNFIHIASGSGCSTGWYEILSQAAGTITVTPTMGSSTDVCVGVVGGSLLTIGQAVTNSVVTNTTWIQSGTYTVTTALNPIVGLTLNGYATSHGDLAGQSCASVSCPLITTATNSTDIVDINSNNPVALINLGLSNTASTRAIAVVCTSFNEKLLIDQVVMDGFKQGIEGNNGGQCTAIIVHALELKNSVGTTTNILNFNATWSITDSYLHGNSNTSGHLLVAGGGGYFARNIVSANTVSSGTDTLIYLNNFVGTVSNNVFVGNTTNSLDILDYPGGSNFFSQENNIFYNNTGVATASAGGAFVANNNAFGSNTSNGPVIGNLPITLTADPFISKSTGNFALNSTAGGGAALKGAGFPGVFPGGTSTGYLDIGAIQSQASSGSGSTVQTTVQN